MCSCPHTHHTPTTPHHTTHARATTLPRNTTADVTSLSLSSHVVSHHSTYLASHCVASYRYIASRRVVSSPTRVSRLPNRVVVSRSLARHRVVSVFCVCRTLLRVSVSAPYPPPALRGRAETDCSPSRSGTQTQTHAPHITHNAPRIAHRAARTRRLRCDVVCVSVQPPKGTFIPTFGSGGSADGARVTCKCELRYSKGVMPPLNL